MQTSNNDLLRSIVQQEYEKKNTEWIKTTIAYMNLIGISHDQLMNVNDRKLKTIIDKWDNDEWVSNMSNKSTLRIYCSYKQRIREEKWYDNSEKSKIMMQARSNTLSLGWRNWTINGDKICELCGVEMETMIHFVIRCNKLQEHRNRYIELQRPNNYDEDATLTSVLLFNLETLPNHEYYKNMICSLWNLRRKILKCQN